MGLINMISILALSCLLVLPAVLADDPPCTRCCNVESTVVESALRLVQCEKGALNCPEEKNLVDDYLPEYMRCLIKSNNRAAGRDGRSMQFIYGFLPANIRSLVCGSGGNAGSDSDSEGSDADSDASDNDSDASDDDGDASDDDSDASDDDSDASEDESDGSEEEDEDEEEDEEEEEEEEEEEVEEEEEE